MKGGTQSLSWDIVGESWDIIVYESWEIVMEESQDTVIDKC